MPEGKDKDGKQTDLPAGSLAFVAPVDKGTKVKILAGGRDAKAIVSSARKGISENDSTDRQRRSQTGTLFTQQLLCKRNASSDFPVKEMMMRLPKRLSRQ